MRGLGGFGRLTTVGLIGWTGGILTEKYFQSSSNFAENDLKGPTVFLGSEILQRLLDKVMVRVPPVVEAAKAFKPANTPGVIPFTDSPDSKGFPSYEQGTDEPSKMNRAYQIMKFGFPGHDNVRAFDDFVLSYDRRTRVPHWVFEHLTRHNTKYNPEVDRARCEFYEDLSIHHYFRATNIDFKGSGYDRGHLAAAGNHRSAQSHCEQTFVLSNMAPQVGKGFNRDSWNRLEKYVRSLTKEYPNVYVCTGPLYLPKQESNGRKYVRYEVIGNNNVAVPTHFFKVIVAELASGHLDMEAYVMPNRPIDDNTPLAAFQVPLEMIEKYAGLLFFENYRVPFRQINGIKAC